MTEREPWITFRITTDDLRHFDVLVYHDPVPPFVGWVGDVRRRTGLAMTTGTGQNDRHATREAAYAAATARLLRLVETDAA